MDRAGGLGLAGDTPVTELVVNPNPGFPWQGNSQAPCVVCNNSALRNPHEELVTPPCLPASLKLS